MTHDGAGPEERGGAGPTLEGGTYGITIVGTDREQWDVYRKEDGSWTLLQPHSPEAAAMRNMVVIVEP